MRNNSVKLFGFGLVVQMSFKEKNYLQLWRPFCSAEQNHLCNFGRGHYEKYFCESILNLDQMLFKDISYLFVWWSEITCAILVEGKIMRNISVKLF